MTRNELLDKLKNADVDEIDTSDVLTWVTSYMADYEITAEVNELKERLY